MKTLCHIWHKARHNWRTFTRLSCARLAEVASTEGLPYGTNFAAYIYASGLLILKLLLLLFVLKLDQRALKHSGERS